MSLSPRTSISRRQVLRAIPPAFLGWSVLGHAGARRAHAAPLGSNVQQAVERGLKWVASTQSKLGHWTAGTYPTAMTALAGTALLASGSTTTQGPYARQIRRAVDYVSTRARDNGLIGDPQRDNRYTYGHGFSMLFLSQILGEEEDLDRRTELMTILNKAIEFSGNAQTQSGGWGYISAKDGSDFDEGSTTITQVQGLRACRNAGLAVPNHVIERAKQYIYSCKNEDGGISYSSTNRGASRPAITAAALACLFNAGDYDGQHVPDMMEYCKKNLYTLASESRAYGHWHYTYLYYSQVVYREGGDIWTNFRDRLFNEIVKTQQADGSWAGDIGPIYVTAVNLTMLQLENGFLPIYQR